MSVNIYDKIKNELIQVAGGTLFADAPIGSISPFGGSVIPSGYLLCNGQSVSRTEYAKLFAVIGTAFGAGNGSTTFNVPDLREATTKGVGLSGKTTGNHYDANGVALGEFVEDRIQNHKHLVYKNYESGATGGAGGETTVGGQVESGGASGRTGVTTEVKAVGVNYIIKAKMAAVPTDIVEGVKEALQYNVLKLVDTINYTKTQNYCHRIATNGAGMSVPFDELESYSDGNHIARIHVMVARKTNSEDLYFKTFIDIPIASGTDPNTGLTIKSYGFIPDWSQVTKSSPSSDGVYNNGIEVFLQRGTYDGVKRDVAGMYYNYSIYNGTKKIVVYMPSKVGFITNSEITTYIEKIQIFKLD